MVVHFPDGRPRVVARDLALRATLADHGSDPVRSLDQRPGHRACGARVDMVHADGGDRRGLLPARSPLCCGGPLAGANDSVFRRSGGRFAAKNASNARMLTIAFSGEVEAGSPENAIVSILAFDAFF